MSPLPLTMLIPPPTPLLVSWVAICKKPLDPDDDDPELTLKDPLVPNEPEAGTVIEKLPLDVELP